MSKKAVVVTIAGRVQGVGYRYSAQRKAEKLNLRGWIKNDYDGTVTLRCEGEARSVDAFISWCSKGPPYAHVANVEIKNIPVEAAGSGTSTGFKIVY